MIPKVDVIIPTYRRPGFLKRAIDSVLNQSYENVDVIVVDDNNDGDLYRRETEILMSAYQENKRVSYIKHSRNLNGAAARNTGIKESTAEYIAFLDDDDFYLPEKIERQVKVMDAARSEDGGCCCFHVRRYKRFAYKVYTVGINYTGDYRFEFLSGLTSLPSSTLLLKSKVFEEIGGFDESFERHQDLEFLMRFFRQFKLNVSPFFDVYMQTDGVRNYPDSETAYQIKRQFLSKYNVDLNEFSNHQRGLILKSQWFEVACIYLKERRIKEARSLFRQFVLSTDVSWVDYLRIIVFLFYGFIPITRKLSSVLIGLTKYRKFSV